KVRPPADIRPVPARKSRQTVEHQRREAGGSGRGTGRGRRGRGPRADQSPARLAGRRRADLSAAATVFDGRPWAPPVVQARRLVHAPLFPHARWLSRETVSPRKSRDATVSAGRSGRYGRVESGPTPYSMRRPDRDIRAPVPTASGNQERRTGPCVAVH